MLTRRRYSRSSAGPRWTGSPAASHASTPPTMSVACGSPIACNEAAARLELVTLAAGDDDDLAGALQLRHAPPACGVEPPLEHGAVDDERPGELAVAARAGPRSGCRRAGLRAHRR